MKKKLEIYFDSKIFTKEAIMRAVYDADIKPSVNIESSDNDCIKVFSDYTFQDFENDKMSKKLKDLVIDNQIRIDTEKEFKIIRNLIVAVNGN